MLVGFNEVLQTADPVADVLIIGAGAVGISMAVDLVRRGKQVILVEAGAQAASEEKQEFFRSARWTGYPLEGLHVGRVRALGGTTNLWPGQLVKFDPIVFERRAWVGDVGWPITLDDLDPFYERGFDLLGLGRRMTDDAVWRQVGAPDLNPGEDLEVFLTRWTPEPKFSILFGEEIKSNPRLRVIVDAAVTSLRMNPGTQAISGVTVTRDDGSRRTLSGRHIVLANGTIEIARLLTLPLESGFPAPWAENPWLGKGFTDHVDVYAGTVFPTDRRRFHALFDNIVLKGLKYTPKVKLTDSAQRRERLLGIAAQCLFHSPNKDALDRLKAPVKALLHGKIDWQTFTIPGRLLPVAAVAIPLATRFLLHRRTYNPPTGEILLRLTSEQAPLKESRLKLLEQRDALGTPLVEIAWQVDPNQLETLARFSEMLVDFFTREKLAAVKLNPLLAARDPAFLSQIDDGNHQMGMARMASNADSGVVDRNLKVFGTDNLYVAGAAAFPTTGFANPTFTGIALGLRLADYLSGVLAR